MDIFMTGGSFAVAVSCARMGPWEYRGNEDKTLSVWGKSTVPVSITTHRGGFIEAVDEEGKIIAEGGDGQLLWIRVGPKPVKLRYKQLPDPELSVAALEKQRRTVTRYLVQDSPGSLGIPDTLTGAIAWMQEQKDKIPDRCRKSAKFDFGTSIEYGETYPEIMISYEEHETDKEVIERIKVERERSRVAQKAEREELRKLQQKYGAEKAETA
jgi:hypothetical protein